MAVCTLGMMAGTVWGQITFNHSQGQLATNAANYGTTAIYQKYYNYVRNLQQTHEYTKTIYVAPGHSKQLVPYELVTNYYNKYMRWFMYDNEADNTNLKKWTNIESMSKYQEASSAGYVYAGTTNIGGNADYYPTFDYNGSDDFDGIKIAMEASNTGVSISNNSSVTEPTLAYRYILLIKNATTLWNDITNHNETYIKANRKAVVATEGMFFQVRLSKPLDDYFNGSKYLTKNDVTLEISRTIDGKDSPLSDEEKQGIYIHESKDVLIIEKPIAGVYTVKIKHNTTTIDEYEITFLPLISAGMLLEEDLKKPGNEGGYYRLSQDSLDNVVAQNDGRAFLLGSIDFDHDEEFDYLNNLTADKTWYPYPLLPWTQSSYAWAYVGFDYASYRIVTTSDSASHHSAIDDLNIKVYGHGATDAGQDAFLYTNVADEPGQMLQLNWDEQICAGSRIYMTFWVNELSNEESANLEVSVSGKRATDGVVEPIRTYITGYVPKGLNDKESTHPLYASTKSCRGNWMQVCYSFITDFAEGEYSEFYFTVNNNTKNSGGADFGLDDIKIYATNPTVEARQESQCNDRYSVEVLLPFRQIAYIYAGQQTWQSGYFAFWKKTDDGFAPIEYDYNGKKVTKYGHFRYNTQFDNNHPDKESVPTDYPDDMYQVEMNAEEYLGFNTRPSIRDLSPDETYYIVFYQSEEDAQGSTSNPQSFSLDTKCLVYSEFEVQLSQVTLVDGVPSNNEWDGCYNQNPTITLEMRTTAEGQESQTYKGYYDVFKGSLSDFNAYSDALSHFRADFPDATDPEDVALLTTEDAQFTTEDQQTLVKAKDQFIYHVLSFSAEYPGDMTNPTNRDRSYTIIPILPEEAPDDETLYCWDPFEFVAHFTKESPYINIGYDDVDYSTYTPSIRVGLADLKGIGTQTLSIPLRDADVVTDGNSIGIYKDNAKVFLNTSEIYTNDPGVIAEYSSVSDPFAEELILGNSPSITKQTDGTYILTLKLDNNTSKIDFKEGYMYGLRLQYQEVSDNGTATTECIGDLVFSLKVVPAYQFWLGSATDNWNNDENWVRAYATDMNNPSGYSDYTSPYEHKGYVPMYFTKVVVPSEHKQVELYEATTTGHTVNIDIPQTAGVTEGATENIEYDLMVKPATGSGYDCEPYYTNTVSEIHFEPNTEMLHTELLSYGKAWVDYELEKGRWYTLASPLQGVVAGDFYTDKSGKEGQAYFSDIKYDPNNNDRFNPSVYQRGWKGSATLQTLSAGEKNVAISGNWSSVYNDVTVPYSEGAGFSLKVQDITDNSSALFRLPKADDEYFYYQKNSTTGGDKKTITRPLNNADKTAYVGKLKTDKTVTLDDLSSLTVTNGTYYLVGNPYMAHINANAFFNANSGLLKKYWLVDSEGQKIAVGSEEDLTTTDANGDATIAPLQSFFVTVTEGQTAPTSITFSRDMQVLGGTNDNLRSSDVLYLTATTPDGKQSRAALAYNLAADKDYEASEDAELFLDSNLSDVPMVYTVAGTMATSINQTSELYNIPVGVYCAGTKGENVSLSFSNLGGFSYATLYDAETGTDTPLHEGSSFNVPANTNGRYFIRAGVPTANEAVQENAIRIYSVGGQLVIASTDLLQQVYIYDFAGRLVDSETRLHTTRYTTDLPAGNYMVKARSVSGEKIEKFKLRN